MFLALVVLEKIKIVKLVEELVGLKFWEQEWFIQKFLNG